MSWVNVGSSLLVWGLFAMGSTLTWRYGAQIMEPVVGIAIPAYQSHKALKMNEEVVAAQKASTWLSKKEVPKLQPSQKLSTWTTYWTVYACFTVVEIFADRIVWWFPLYYELKLVSLVALQYPIPFVTDEPGAAIIYQNVVKPFLGKNEPLIDSTIDYGKQQLLTYSTFGLDVSKYIVDNLTAKNIKSLPAQAIDLLTKAKSADRASSPSAEYEKAD